MPIENGVGYGEYTGVKVEHLGKILAMHLAITQAVIEKHAAYFDIEYRYIDLTAGQGSTPDGNLGSPLIFLDRASNPKFRIPFRVDLIEREPDNIAKLKGKVDAHPSACSGNGRFFFYANRYQDVIPALLLKQDDKELGLAYIDHSGDLPDIDTLAYLSRMRPRMDVLLYLSATNVKRQFQQTGRKLADFLSATGKQYWLIRKPYSGDNHQWTFLLGSNSDLFKPHKSISRYFYRLDSSEGQAVFEKLNLSQEQRVEQVQPRLTGFDN